MTILAGRRASVAAARLKLEALDRDDAASVPLPARRGVHQVGDAQEVRDEEGLRIVDVPRGTDLIHSSEFITARRSDMVSASSWSCVT